MKITSRLIFPQLKDASVVEGSQTLQYTGHLHGHQFAFECRHGQDDLVRLSIFPSEHTPCDKSVLFVWTPHQPKLMLERMVRRFFSMEGELV